MYIKLEEGAGCRVMSFADAGKETYMVINDSQGTQWRLWENKNVGISHSSCQVCTVEELWEALRKVAEDKIWTPG